MARPLPRPRAPAGCGRGAVGFGVWGFTAAAALTAAAAIAVGVDDVNEASACSVEGADLEACAPPLLSGEGEDDGEALVLRQLRAVGRHSGEAAQAEVKEQKQELSGGQRAQQTASPEGDAVGEEDPDDVPGIPGGWGEAAQFTDEANKAEKENAGTLQANSGHWGSCHQYHCITYYAKWHGCQCNDSCMKYGSCCYDYYNTCHHHQPAPTPAPWTPPPHVSQVMTLYHVTSDEAGPLILENGFKPGFEGWCGGGIYFATSPEATRTKAIGPESHQGFMIEARVDVGRVKYMGKYCDRSLNGQEVSNQAFNSVSFDPGDGQEYIVYSKDRVLSTKHIAMPY